MQQLCDKLAVAKRTTKAKAQLKEKYQMRFKVLGERLKKSNGRFKVLGERLKKSNGNFWENHKQWIFKASVSWWSREFLKVILQWVSIKENFKFTVWAS